MCETVVIIMVSVIVIVIVRTSIVACLVSYG